MPVHNTSSCRITSCGPRRTAIHLSMIAYWNACESQPRGTPTARHNAVLEILSCTLLTRGCGDDAYPDNVMKRQPLI